MEAIISTLREQELSELDTILVNRAEALIASGYADSEALAARFLLKTSVIKDSALLEEVTILASAGPQPLADPETISRSNIAQTARPEFVMAAVNSFRKDLLNQKRDQIAQMLEQLRGGPPPQH